MINIYKKITRSNLQKTDSIKKGCWINASKPTKKELENLSSKLHIPIDFLTDPLDLDERARIEKEDHCILIIIRIPYDNTDNDVPFITIPIGVILSENNIVTVCSKSNDVISCFLSEKIKNFSTSKKNRFILQIFYQAALEFLKCIKIIERRTNIIEKELHKSMKNEELIKLLNIEKSLVFFTTSLRANELMMERLNRSKILKMYHDDKEILEDVIIENRQAIEMSNIHSNILSGMMDAFASVISNNLNVLMKLLTMITIILMIPTFFVSIFGMNVGLPLQHYPHAFLIIISGSVLVSAITVVIFKKRKWF